MTARHVVIVAPPWYPVPPVGYGGIELVVGLLSRALRQAGHNLRVALLMLKLNVSAQKAKGRLAGAKGDLRRALGE